MSNTTPEVPGQVVEAQYLKELRSRVRELVGVSNFPGAQPISFNSVHLQELQNENYFVCEKSDGIRILVYITSDNSGQQVFLIDRRNYYRYVPNLFFPIPNDPTYSQYHYETLIDGELVNDIEDGEVTLKLLTFDLLVIDGKNLMSRPLTSRLGYLKENIIIPYEKMLSNNPELVKKQPFIIELKQMELSYGLDKVLDTVIPNLKHKNDGLVFTSVTSDYKPGQASEKMLKWKPPNEISIDFLLRFDIQDDDEKPRFCLHKWITNDERAYFDDMYVTDDEWNEFWKQDYNKYEGKIIEVVYDPTMNPNVPWRFSRFRHDKLRANNQNVIEETRQSIIDGITEEQLRSHITSIREAWKKREEADNYENDKKSQRINVVTE